MSDASTLKDSIKAYREANKNLDEKLREAERVIRQSRLDAKARLNPNS